MILRRRKVEGCISDLVGFVKMLENERGVVEAERFGQATRDDRLMLCIAKKGWSV